jgi:hypothetical protein
MQRMKDAPPCLRALEDGIVFLATEIPRYYDCSDLNWVARTRGWLKVSTRKLVF